PREPDEYSTHHKSRATEGTREDARTLIAIAYQAFFCLPSPFVRPTAVLVLVCLLERVWGHAFRRADRQSTAHDHGLIAGRVGGCRRRPAHPRCHRRGVS